MVINRAMARVATTTNSFLVLMKLQDCLRVLEENELVDKRRGYIDTNGISFKQVLPYCQITIANLGCILEHRRRDKTSLCIQ